MDIEDLAGKAGSPAAQSGVKFEEVPGQKSLSTEAQSPKVSAAVPLPIICPVSPQWLLTITLCPNYSLSMSTAGQHRCVNFGTLAE